METVYLPNDSRAFLQEELNMRKKRRPHYSLRAFARDLEMSPSSLCEFLSGRQGMSKERIQWIGQRIKLSDLQISHFCDLVESEFGRTEKERRIAKMRVSTRIKDDKNRISIDEFYFISDWYHLTLLEVLALKDQNYSHEELAQILSISVEELELGLNRLIHLGLLKQNKGKYEVQSEATIAGGEGPSRAIQMYHEQYLQMQADSISRKSSLDRENISVSLQIAQEDWLNMREEIKQSVISILTKYASNEKSKNQVVCFALQAITLLDNPLDHTTKTPLNNKLKLKKKSKEDSIITTHKSEG